MASNQYHNNPGYYPDRQHPRESQLNGGNPPNTINANQMPYQQPNLYHQDPQCGLKGPEMYSNNPYSMQTQILPAPSTHPTQRPTSGTGSIVNQMETVSLNDQKSPEQNYSNLPQFQRAVPPPFQQYPGMSQTNSANVPSQQPGSRIPTIPPQDVNCQKTGYNEQQITSQTNPYASSQYTSKNPPLMQQNAVDSQGYPPVSNVYSSSPTLSSSMQSNIKNGMQQPPPTSMQQRYPNEMPGTAQPHQPVHSQSYPSYGSPYNQGHPPPSFQQQQPQQAQRLDPDAMPSVVQVVEDDKAKYIVNGSLSYTTSIPAALPPLCTTFDDENIEADVRDGGSVRPNHVRATIYQVPSSEDVLKITNIPLSIVVKPFDEKEANGNMLIPVTNSEIVRCNRCKAYMSPYMRFIDGGRRFQCALCNHITEIPTSFFANLDHTGQRLDKYERPELFLGSYEFRATAEFCRNGILNCRRPHIIFAFELTVNSKPVLHHISKELANIIRSQLPIDPLNPGTPPPLVGFVTYNSKIQMYDVKNNGHSHIICDVSSTFPPFTSFLVDPVEYADQIDSFLSTLPSLVNDDELETETILGPVVEAVLQTAQFDNSNWFNYDKEDESFPKDPKLVTAVGKVYLFHCTLPTYGQDGVTPGKLHQRWTTSLDEARKLLGTDKEKQIISPEPSKYYSNLAQRCVTDYGSGVELFLFPPVNGPFIDVASISELVRLTGTGAIFKYYNDYSNRFINDLKVSLQSSFAFDSIMKVRTSTGIRAVEYFGNYYARTTSDIELSTINAGTNVGVELKYDDKLPDDEFVVVQVATLYTSVSGDRRVRIHNLALSVCQQVSDVFRSACCDTIVNTLIRQSVAFLRLGEKTNQQIKENLITKCVGILTAYRKHCAQPGSSLGQLILPEGLKLLPVYLTGLLKCDAIDGGPEMMPDDKSYAQIRTLSANNSMTQVIVYPRLLRLEYNINGDLSTVYCRSSTQRLSNENAMAYILENGFYIFLYIPGSNMSHKQNNFLRNVFGIENIQQLHPESPLPYLTNSDSQFINKLINTIKSKRHLEMKVQVVRQGIDKIESVFKTFLYEDKKQGGNYSGDSGKFDSVSYVDLLCHLHKEIRNQLN